MAAKKIEKSEANPPETIEFVRSEELSLPSMRRICSAIHTAAQSFVRQECEGKPLATMVDVAAEYNAILRAIDEFYAKARYGIGNVKIRLVADSTAFTKESEGLVREYNLTLAK